jgi:hypothetical protein
MGSCEKKHSEGRGLEGFTIPDICSKEVEARRGFFLRANETLGGVDEFCDVLLVEAEPTEDAPSSWEEVVLSSSPNVEASSSSALRWTRLPGNEKGAIGERPLSPHDEVEFLIASDSLVISDNGSQHRE